MTENSITDERDRLSEIMTQSSQFRSYYADVYRELIKSVSAMGDLFGWKSIVEDLDKGTRIQLKNQEGKTVFYAICGDGHLQFKTISQAVELQPYKSLYDSTISQFIRINMEHWITDMGSAGTNYHGFTNGVSARQHTDQDYYYKLAIPYHIALETKAISLVVGSFIEKVNYRIRMGRIAKPEGYDERFDAAGIKSEMRL